MYLHSVGVICGHSGYFAIMRTQGLLGMHDNPCTPLVLQSKGRWQQNPLFCRSSASEAAGPLPLAVEVPQMPHDGGSGGQPDQSSTQPGLTGAPQTT